MPELWSHTTGEAGGTRTVTLTGELDMSGAGELLTVLVAAVEGPGATAVRADLGGVDFLDSSGMHALIQAHRAAQSAGRDFAVVGARGHIRRVLDIAGLLPLLADEGHRPAAGRGRLAG